jgi:hypothetical protein
MGLAATADKPADGATVTLTGPVGRTATADGNGFYGFVDLPPAVYRVAVSQTIRPVTVTAGIVATLNITR